MGQFVPDWTVDYGNGPIPVRVPHTWGLDVPVAWEGPAIYRTTLHLADLSHPVVRFWGVSYRAEVLVDGELAIVHDGIWDWFDVALSEQTEQKSVQVEVRVTKNGGSTYPVRDVASGFLPFVFHTFGGIFREVELFEGVPPVPGIPKSRVSINGSQICVDGKPFLVRGLLHWGWYDASDSLPLPQMPRAEGGRGLGRGSSSQDLLPGGSPNPSAETIENEVRQAKLLGFNLVKFCLWLPPHRYLDILREHGMFAWIEFPLWDPSANHVDAQVDEIVRIAEQYAHHDNVIAWTGGCELGGGIPHTVRADLVNRLNTALNRPPLLKDNSGGSEMYGTDVREYGTFDDFHPYGDTHFYPDVLDTLLPGPREAKPILLGEFNDIDVHRDLPRLRDAFWASANPALNDQGVRWQYDLPTVFGQSPFATDSERHQRLMSSSREKALFMRKTVQEAVRARPAIGGYVITGWRDTPISSAGFFDDWNAPRFSPAECVSWNGPDVFFLIPARRPPWVNGGNRPGWRDPLNHFTGPVQLRVGLASERGGQFDVRWRIEGTSLSGSCHPDIPSLDARQFLTIDWENALPGEYTLVVETDSTTNRWPIWVIAELESGEEEQLQLPSPLWGRGVGGEGAGAVPAPFWREAAYEFHGLPDFANHWARLLPIAGDQTIPLESLPTDAEILIRRIDTRTYIESAVLARVGDEFFTTLRPEGGLGTQPHGLRQNPAGVALLRIMADQS